MSIGDVVLVMERHGNLSEWRHEGERRASGVIQQLVRNDGSRCSWCIGGSV